MGCWNQHHRHCKLLFQRRVGENYWVLHQEGRISMIRFLMLCIHCILQYDIPREKLVIATKVYYIVHPDPTIVSVLYPNLLSERDFVNQWGLSRAAIFYQVEESLRRLGTTYIDLLQVHYFDAITPLEETMRALHDLVVSGKVRYLGASNMRAWQVAQMNAVAARNGWTEFVSVQVEHSLLYRPEVRPALF